MLQTNLNLRKKILVKGKDMHQIKQLILYLQSFRNTNVKLNTKRTLTVKKKKRTFKGFAFAYEFSFFFFCVKLWNIFKQRDPKWANSKQKTVEEILVGLSDNRACSPTNNKNQASANQHKRERMKALKILPYLLNNRFEYGRNLFWQIEKWPFFEYGQ